MSLTVFFGQLYVGYGYRLMHGSMLDLMDKVDGVLLHKKVIHLNFIQNECKSNVFVQTLVRR